MSDMTPADVMALNNYNRDDFFNGGGLWYIIILFFIFGMFGGNFGGFGNAYAQGNLTRAELADGFNTADIKRTVADNGRDILENRFENLRGQGELQREILENRYDAAIAAQVAQAQQSQCCCELKTAIHAEGEATRALIQQQTIDDLKAQLNQAQTAVANAVQTNNILNSIGRFVTNPPVNPYNSYNACGCGCGCS